ncbi:GNAT family N-acetyltransferase [Deinococcus pimensis]|uniref:GNAT family N-acetyltransferase n=1 Tax=Deinococcus pimensis TaxID=309888 RepID=UPI0004B068B5|nr:GNAT family N-acetyltransferase [Deinococcus pimensis]
MTPLHTPAHVRERIDTARLSLRAPRAQDGPALHAAVHASLPELRAWMIWAAHPLDEAGYTDHLRGAAERFEERSELRYLIFDRAMDTLVGSTGIHALDWRVPKGEVG